MPRRLERSGSLCTVPAAALCLLARQRGLTAVGCDGGPPAPLLSQPSGLAAWRRGGDPCLATPSPAISQLTQRRLAAMCITAMALMASSSRCSNNKTGSPGVPGAGCGAWPERLLPAAHRVPMCGLLFLPACVPLQRCMCAPPVVRSALPPPLRPRLAPWVCPPRRCGGGGTRRRVAVAHAALRGWSRAQRACQQCCGTLPRKISAIQLLGAPRAPGQHAGDVASM